MRARGLGSLVLVVLAGLAPLRAQPAASGDSLGAPDLQSVVWQLYDSEPRPAAGGGCDLPPEAPFRLPAHPPAHAIGLVFADGRAARWDEVETHAGVFYWPMERACSALDATLIWDPERMGGRLLVDTLTIRFAVGAEVIHCADSALQVSGPVLYLGNRLLLPLDAIPLLVDPFLAHRFVFARESAVLYQKPALPATRVEIFTDLGRTHLSWKLPREPAASLSVDGGSALVVDIPGAGVDPRTPPRETATLGACLRAVQPGARGTRFVFRVDPSIVAWQTGWRRDRGEYEVVLSPRVEDLGRMDEFPRWTPARRPGAGAPVVLALPASEHGGGRLAAAEEFVCALGERIGQALQARGLKVAVVEQDGGDDPAKSATAAANAQGGALCLFLQADACGDTLAVGYRIVTAATLPGARPLLALAGASQDAARAPRARAEAGEAPVVMQPWETVAPQHGERSDDFAWFLGLHLRAAQIVAGGPGPHPRVARQHWPGGPLEGLDMPGAVLYVGRAGAGSAFPAEADWNGLEGVGEAIARSIEAFLAWEPER
jgi:hypothetical protein